MRIILFILMIASTSIRAQPLREYTDIYYRMNLGEVYNLYKDSILFEEHFWDGGNPYDLSIYYYFSKDSLNYIHIYANRPIGNDKFISIKNSSINELNEFVVKEVDIFRYRGSIIIPGKIKSETTVIDAKNNKKSKKCEGCLDIISINDIEGNRYAIVQIGEQCWMAENLRTNKFANGTIIKEINEESEWRSLISPAWCNYDNNISNELIYGKLYNWYTVSDTNKLCPIGWHVPNDSDWYVLINYIGGERFAGDKLKTVTGWIDLDGLNNLYTTNECGFSGLPGGLRRNYSNFQDIGKVGCWWSSTEIDSNRASFYILGKYSFIAKKEIQKNNGSSVRCIKD